MTEDTNTGVTESVAETHVETAEAAPQVTEKELNFSALRNEVQNLQRQNEMLQMQIMQKQQLQPVEDEGINLDSFRDDDIPTYGELKRLRKQENKSRQQMENQLREMEARSQYPDYDDVIRQFLPDVLQEDPDLAAAIKDNPKVNKLAYKLAKSNPKYHERRLVAQNQSAVDRMVENSSRPAPANSRKNVMVQDEEAKLANMSDDQILSMFNMSKARS